MFNNNADLDLGLEFERFIDSLRVYDNVSDMTGSGTEYLEINGTVIAKFYNGQLTGNCIVNNDATRS